MNGSIREFAVKSLAWLLVVALPTAGCRLAPAPERRPGLPEFQAFGIVAVPGGVYNVAGGNLMVRRADVSVDTRILANTALEATYNSAVKRWHWSYEMSFDGETFVDREGAVYAVGSLPDGAAIPGTYWVKLDSDTVKTKGGLVFDFDAQGRLHAESWSSDPYPRYEYERSPERLELRECAAPLPIGQCRHVFSADLGPFGPSRIVDEESARLGVVRESRYDYDLLGRLQTARTPFELDAVLPGTRYEYGSAGLLTAQIDSEGSRIEYRWIFGWLLQVTQVGEGDPSHAFTPPQLVGETESLHSVVHANPLGGRTRYTFTDAGHVTSIERMDASEVMSVAWNPTNNRPSQIVGFDGSVRQFQGWVDDDPTVVIEASGNVVQLEYEADGIDAGEPLDRPIASVVDSLGLVRAVTYDPDGRPVAIANGAGEVTTRDYVGAEVSKTTAPWGATVDFLSYGVHGHWRTGIVSPVSEVLVQRKFDRVGNLLVPGAGLQEGGLLQRANGATRLLQSLDVGATDENGVVTSTDFVGLTRRGDGQLIGVARPRSADHAFEYDALGRLSRLRERVDGTWTDTTLEYDAAGHLTALEQANGMREEFDFDAYGRLVERRVLRDAVVEGHARLEWADGRVSRWYDSVRDQWETLSYDAAGRLRTILYSALGESLTHDFDLRSRTTKKTFQLGVAVRVIEMEWDLADRRTRVFTRDATGAQQDVVRLEYQQGRLLAIEYGNGLRRESLFDPATDRFAGYRTTDVASSVLVEQSTITREATTGPTRLEVTSETETPLATTREQYWLGLGGNLQSPESKIGARVFRWEGRTWVGGVLQDADAQVYAWDELSNRVDDADGNLFTYNPERNRLLAATVNGASHTYTYDAAGYATSRDGMPITWSAAGKLATLGPAVDPLVEIVTDLAERPVSVTSLGATRDFALFGGRVEYDASTGETGRLHLAHVSLPFEGEERIYRHVDALGNVSFTTDENGLVTSHRRYHSFGLDRIYGGGSFSENDPRGFAGGIELQHGGVGTGLVVLGARVLDSDVGRFLSRDPFFDLLNAYTYAYGNPVQYQDRSGRIAAPKGAENQAAALEHQATKLDADAAQAQFEARVLGSVAGGMLALSKKLAPHEPRAAAIAAGLAVGVGALAAARETQAAAYQSDAAKLRLRAAELSAATEGGSGGGGGGGFDEFLIPFDYEAPPPIGWEGPCGPTHAMVEGGSLRMGWLLLTLAVVLSLLRPSAIRSRTRKSDRGREICDPEPARAGDGVR